MSTVSLLDEKSTALLNAMRSLGTDWVTRTQIAQVIGRTQLRGEEFLLLDYLIKENQIEAKVEVIPGSVVQRWLYRIK